MATHNRTMARKRHPVPTHRAAVELALARIHAHLPIEEGLRRSFVPAREWPRVIGSAVKIYMRPVHAIRPVTASEMGMVEAPA